jgi:hypothetical protein
MGFLPCDLEETATQSRFFLVGRTGRRNAGVGAYTGLHLNCGRVFFQDLFFYESLSKVQIRGKNGLWKAVKQWTDLRKPVRPSPSTDPAATRRTLEGFFDALAVDVAVCYLLQATTRPPMKSRPQDAPRRTGLTTPTSTFGVRVNDEQNDWLEAEGKRQGITAASVVRALIDAARKARP